MQSLFVSRQVSVFLILPYRYSPNGMPLFYIVKLLYHVTDIINSADVLSIAAVNPWNPLSDDAHDFIMNGIGHGSNLIHRDSFAVFFPNDGNLHSVAQIGDSGDIQHQLIHADSAYDVCKLSVYQHTTAIGQTAVVSIRVSNGTGGNAHILLGGQGSPMAGFRSIFPSQALSGTSP